MSHLPSLFKIIELTRSQPQTGYSLAGIPQDQLSNLAEHHYLVTFISWQLARSAKRAGADINVERVLEYALIHDTAELLGGDISAPYARVNRRAYKKAKAFEYENCAFLVRFFGEDKNAIRKLYREIMDAKSDEALLAKAGDYVEFTMYKFYIGRLTKSDIVLSKERLDSYIKRMKDPIAKTKLSEFAKAWLQELPGKSAQEILTQK